MNEIIEYMKIHLISLEQDLEKNFGNYTPEDNAEYMEYIASIDTTAHLLSVAEGILNK